jgi:hypothetical protein
MARSVAVTAQSARRTLGGCYRHHNRRFRPRQAWAAATNETTLVVFALLSLAASPIVMVVREILVAVP